MPAEKGTSDVTDAIARLEMFGARINEVFWNPFTALAPTNVIRRGSQESLSNFITRAASEIDAADRNPKGM